MAEWQTRRSQKPMGFTPREGSTPSPGTLSKMERKDNFSSLYWKLSKPWPTLKQMLGNTYSRRVFDMQQDYVKSVAMYSNDTYINYEVWLDDNGRPLRIVGNEEIAIMVYDDKGYLTEEEHSRNDGSKTESFYTYENVRNGSKRLILFKSIEYKDDLAKTSQLKFDKHGNIINE